MQTWWVRGGTDTLRCKRMEFQWALQGLSQLEGGSGSKEVSVRLEQLPLLFTEGSDSHYCSVHFPFPKTEVGKWELIFGIWRREAWSSCAFPAPVSKRFSFPSLLCSLHSYPGSLLTQKLFSGSVYHRKCSFFFL